MSVLILLLGGSRFVDSFKLCGEGSSHFLLHPEAVAVVSWKPSVFDTQAVHDLPVHFCRTSRSFCHPTTTNTGSGSSLSLCGIKWCWNHTWWVPLPKQLFSSSGLMEKSHISFTPSPQIFALSKMGIPAVLNPGLDEMVTALSKRSGFILRMSPRLLFPHSCSPSQFPVSLSDFLFF